MCQTSNNYSINIKNLQDERFLLMQKSEERRKVEVTKRIRGRKYQDTNGLPDQITSVFTAK